MRTIPAQDVYNGLLVGFSIAFIAKNTAESISEYSQKLK